MWARTWCVSRPAGFVTKSKAPSMRASTVAGEPSLVRLLTMITFARLPRRRNSRSAPRPSSRGMETSSVTTSGLSDSAWATASRPS